MTINTRVANEAKIFQELKNSSNETRVVEELSSSVEALSICSPRTPTSANFTRNNTRSSNESSSPVIEFSLLPIEIKENIFVHTADPQFLTLVNREYFKISKSNSVKARWILNQYGHSKTLLRERLLRFPTFNSQILVILIKNNADFKADDHFALRFAAENGYLRSCELLINRGADLTALENHALHLACYNGHIEVVKLLLKHGADIHSMNGYALRFSCYNAHLSVVKLLLHHGARIDTLNHHALFLAAYKYRVTSQVKFLKVIKLLWTFENGVLDVLENWEVGRGLRTLVEEISIDESEEEEEGEPNSREHDGESDVESDERRMHGSLEFGRVEG
ncbi:ankyrin repeat-containing domain protein [Paraphysoderma sedebokerense]|nr:ankyrin repeat-containing domain protein [Paraphysoderma sedebokerense]